MKKLLYSFFVIACFLMTSCHTSKKVSIYNYTTPISQDVEVQVIGIGQKVPDKSTLVGTVKIGEGGMTSTQKCTYQAVINDAIVQSRSMGGNLIQIVEHKEPDFWSSCHRIKVDVYKK